jgi:mRNA-degrading endonuclease RelE of RelBE toxin-antitoxin system
MFQIIFNEISAAELASLPKETQFEILEQFQILPEDFEKPTSEKYGVIERDGKKLYRYYAKNNYRIYFEKTAEGVTIHRVLHKSTFRDFLFRSKLPMAEDEQLGKSKVFWKLIKEGQEAGKK